MEDAEYDELYAVELGHWRFRAIRRLLLGFLRRERARRGGAPLRVLDAGCGTGGTTLALAELGSAVGVDLHPRALALARRRGPLRLARASVAALPFAGASFDAVVSVDVLYHRAVADDAAALAELARVCRPGGALLLWLPCHEWLRSSHDTAVHTARRYALSGVRALAREAGLEVEHLSGAHAPLLPLALARRWLEGGGERARRLGVGGASAPGPVGALLEGVLSLEGALIRRVSLPVGLSAFAVLRRPAPAGAASFHSDAVRV
jgi:SAM-dependent methyltransferase